LDLPLQLPFHPGVVEMDRAMFFQQVQIQVRFKADLIIEAGANNLLNQMIIHLIVQ